MSTKRRSEGRYGMDRLNSVLLVFGFVLAIALTFTRKIGWVLVGYIPMAICLLRVFSRNRKARERENDAYMDGVERLKAVITGGGKKKTAAARKHMKAPAAKAPAKKSAGSASKQTASAQTYKRLTCPACGHAMKVPCGRGRVRITCRACGEKFVRTI